VATYRVGIIGGGRMGTHYGRGYTLNPSTEVVAVADTDAENLELFCRRFKVPGYSSYEEMLKKERIDIGAPVLPVRANADAVVACARAGVKATFCEKPLTASLEDADRMVEECRSRGIHFAAGLVPRNYPQHWKARAIIEGGELGEVRSINIYDGNGQGGCHGMNMARMFARDAEVDWVVGWVDGDPWSDYEEGHREGERGFGAIGGYIRFRNGLECFSHYRPSARRGVEAVCERGVFASDFFSSFGLWKVPEGVEPGRLDNLKEVEGAFAPKEERTSPDGSRKRDSEGWIYPTDGMMQSIAALVDTLERGAPLRLTSGDDLRKALEICIALRESARKGHCPVRLPLEDRSLKMYPVLERWNYKKEVLGRERYMEDMAVYKKE